MTKDIMDVKGVAEYLDFSPTKIYRMLSAGEIPYVKVGGQYRFPKSTIDDWLAGKLTLPEGRKPIRATMTATPTSNGSKEAMLVEDRIVGCLLVYKERGLKGEREKAKAKALMSENLTDIDWAYLADKADKAGVLADAIGIEKEINRGS